jgi:hypothetical protein
VIIYYGVQVVEPLLSLYSLNLSTTLLRKHHLLATQTYRFPNLHFRELVRISIQLAIVDSFAGNSLPDTTEPPKAIKDNPLDKPLEICRWHDCQVNNPLVAKAQSRFNIISVGILSPPLLD